MDLAERLRQLGYGGAAAPAGPPRPRHGPGVEQIVPGEFRETPHGRCFVAKTVYPLDHAHGGIHLASVFGLPSTALVTLGRSSALEALDFRRVAFLDTETTGLAGGTGTYVFLVGLGFFQGDEFLVEQYFMRDYGEERAMLAALGRTIARFPAIVSFNGKVFDWPLLQTRFALARQQLQPAEPLHLDLLFPARRLWRERLGSCALSALEEGVLDVRRQVDVPSWLIPSIYFEYVREGDARPLRPVFAHNEHDILSLLALTVRLGRHIADPLHEAAHPVDLFATGRIFEGALAWEECILCYEKALAGDLPLRLREEALCRLGLVYKRLQRGSHAERTWRALVERPDCLGTLPFVELAKHLEHRERDFAAAAVIVERALGLLARRRADPWDAGRGERERRELEHRLARLRQKVAKKASAGG